MAVDSIGDVVRSSTATRGFWLWPNLLSLDAPLIAVIWQILLARNLGLHLNRGEPLVLALCVWFVYLADRILDAMRPPACTWEPARKTFCRDHLAVASTTALLLLSLILPLAQRLLRPATFYGGLSLAVPLALYMAIVHLSPSSLRMRWPREVVIAGLFSVGTFLAVWIASGRNGDTLWAPALLFSLLCWSNCCAIETWEWQANDFCANEQPSDSTRWVAEHLPVVGGVIAVFAAAAGCFALAPANFSAAAFLSGVALAALAVNRSHLRLDALRVAADLALCTPLLVFTFVP